MWSSSARRITSGSDFADRTSDATVTVTCSGIAAPASYAIALGPSPIGNSSAPRYMGNTSGGPAMAFNVFRDATYSTVWGDGISGDALTGSLAAGDSRQTHAVFGRIPGGQSSLYPGSFSASMPVTISYEP